LFFIIYLSSVLSHLFVGVMCLGRRPITYVYLLVVIAIA